MKLLLPCRPPPEEPTILLHLLLLLFSALSPCGTRRLRWPDSSAWLMAGSDLLLPGLRASPSPPARGLAPACPGLLQPGERGAGKRVSAGAGPPVPAPPERKISCLGFPQSHQPGGHPGASGRAQVEAGACQRPGARGIRGSG